MLFLSFLYVLFLFLLVFVVVWLFVIFEWVNVEFGFEYYVEKGDLFIFFKMLVNVLINLGYLLFGIYLLWKICKL